MLARAGSERRVSVAKTKTFPAPVKGWVQSGNITTAPQDQAEVLDNFFPTAQGAKLRGGASEYADIGAAVLRLFNYVSGDVETLFASTSSKLFDSGRINGGGSNAFGDIEGLSGGDWSAVQMSTSGGEFIVAVNGEDHALYYDSSTIEPISTVAVNNLAFDAETAAFAVGETVTGGTSGATAEILAIAKTSTTAGTLKVGAITGAFVDNETITDGATGSATSDIPSGTSSASSVTITNVATAALSQVWSFKRRLFFVEKDTQSAWYLPVDSIGGAATEINLGPIFAKGGNLLFGARWSLDSGSGIDDVCLFVSTEGEVAVYEGTDPSSASTWSLVGVYDIAEPLDKHSHFKAGGDLAILTKDGIIPVSAALRKDRAALSADAITYPIEDAWKEIVEEASGSYPVTATLWQSGTLLLVGTPQEVRGLNVSVVANARTGAWARYLGWDVRCSAESGGNLYFGNAAGKVLQADVGGLDDGVAFSGVYVPKFSECGTSNLKSATHAGLTYRASQRAALCMYAFGDYEVGEIPAPPSSAVDDAAVWGTGVWGTFVWGGSGQTSTYTIWESAAANGHALAYGVAVTSGEAGRLPFEILAGRLRYETGYAL